MKFRLRHCGTALLAALSCACAIAQPASLPIADAHFHLMPFMTPVELKSRMDKNGIAWTVSTGAIGIPGVASPTQRDGAVRDLLGDRFLEGVGGREMYQAERSEGTAYYTAADNATRTQILQAVDRELAVRPRSIAETYPNAETSSADPLRRRRVPTDSPFFQGLLEVAARHGVPVPMHMQWNPESVEQLARLLASQPKALVVLSHCGKDSQAAQIRAFFERVPNVVCDLSFRSLPQAAAESRQDPARLVFWPESMFQKAGMKSEWKQLVEDFPDRFMVGIDDVHSWDDYDRVASAIRTGLLAQLTPAAAEQVAWRNAVRIFRLQGAPPAR